MPLPDARILVAGLGNIFLGDDAFGVEVVRRLSQMNVPEHVRLMDVGVRSVHLAYELRERAYETVILIDVVSTGDPAGTISVLQPESDGAAGPRVQEGHGVGPHEIAALVRQLGGKVPRMMIVACQPSRIGPEAGLSEPVAAAVDGAVQTVMRLLPSDVGAMPAQS
jgi:hydrogenase maturation protease